MFPSKPQSRAKNGGGGNRTRVVFPQKRPPKATYVYFIQVGDDGPVKIGVASDPDRRRTMLQIGCPWPLRILCEINCHDAAAYEAQLHERFADHRIRGEWFEPGPTVAYVENLWAEEFASLGLAEWCRQEQEAAFDCFFDRSGS